MLIIYVTIAHLNELSSSNELMMYRIHRRFRLFALHPAMADTVPSSVRRRHEREREREIQRIGKRSPTGCKVSHPLYFELHSVPCECVSQAETIAQYEYCTVARCTWPTADDPIESKKDVPIFFKRTHPSRG